jgi:hypothetical protein
MSCSLHVRGYVNSVRVQSIFCPECGGREIMK